MSAAPVRSAQGAIRRPRSLLAIGLGVALAIGLASCSTAAKVNPHAQASQASQAPLGFRSLPSFLPTAAPVDQIVTASPGHPQLAVQGVAVEVAMASGHVLATMTGPKVPPFVAPPPEQVTAVFDISLKNVSGSVPVRLDDFTITDQLGRTFHPALVLNETPPPSTLTSGHDLDLQVTAVMPTGEGRLYWAPTQSGPFVGWDFIVEND